MYSLKRKHVNKHHSAKKFRKNISTVKAANIRIHPMRGGWRL